MVVIPLPNIGKPAEQALEQLNITSLNDISKVDEATLLKIHGVGPKAIRILKEELKEKGMEFAKPVVLTINPSFAVLGDLKCDNAPKRRVIRDFIIARTANSQTGLNNTVTEGTHYQILNGKKKVAFSEIHQTITKENNKISSMIIHHNISHGKEGASETVVILNNGEQIYIADFFLFENHKKDSKIHAIKSYIV